MKHVALVGLTGVGKSTLVNLLSRQEVAATNNTVRPCTTKTQSYNLVDPATGTSYCIWDTWGVNERNEWDLMPTRLLKSAGLLPDAERELKEFLRGKSPQISLVMLCIDAKKIKVPYHWKVYNKIYADFCEKSIPVVLVVTRMRDSDFESSKWKQTIEDAMKGVVPVLPSRELMEAVPMFDELDESRAKACRTRMFRLLHELLLPQFCFFFF